METILGTVVGEPQVWDGICTYEILVDDKKYLVRTDKYQAALDNIFINIGQRVQITGEITGRTIHVLESKILLRSRKGREKQ